jgi:hypothetical protein
LKVFSIGICGIPLIRGVLARPAVKGKRQIRG